jgi:hypothetical protein
MACIYCRQREAEVARRCYQCADYLDQLHASDDQAAREYATLIVLTAHRNLVGRAA